VAAPAVYPFLAAVVSRLAALGLPVGNHAAPAGVAPPYLFVALVPGGDVTGSTAAPSDDGYLMFRVHAVAAGAEAALWHADRVRTILVGWRPAVPGRSLMPVQLENATDGAFPDFDTTPPRFTAVDQYGCWNYPA
jgi:hypothetical protein